MTLLNHLAIEALPWCFNIKGKTANFYSCFNYNEPSF